MCYVNLSCSVTLHDFLVLEHISLEVTSRYFVIIIPKISQ